MCFPFKDNDISYIVSAAIGDTKDTAVNEFYGEKQCKEMQASAIRFGNIWQWNFTNFL